MLRPGVGEARCDIYGCGSNSPSIFGNPVGGLAVVGNDDRDGLIPGSLVAPLCPDASSLDVRQGWLVGLDQQGMVRCTARQLLGSSFSLFVNGTQGRLWISDMALVATWEQDAALSAAVPTYRFTVTDGGTSICPLRTATWMEPWQIANVPSMPGSSSGTGPTGGGGGADPSDIRLFDTQQWDAETDHALIVHGETYTSSGEIDQTGPGWFNVACAGNALAKMRLLGFNPTATGGRASRDRSSTPAERVTTLKMLTARYAGVTSYTTQGQPLLWISGSGIRYWGDFLPASPVVGPIESTWDAQGAPCLSHLRTWTKPTHRRGRDGAREAERVALIARSARRITLSARPGAPPVTTAIPQCPENATVASTRGQAAKPPTPPTWTTYTIDHVTHPHP